MDGYPFTIPYTVRVADLNYGGHVSNAAVLNFFQDARIAFLAALGPYAELDIGEGKGIILVEAQQRYLAEMFLGDQLEIGVRLKELRHSTLVLEYRIERDGRPTVEGTTRLSAFDYQQRRVCRLPSSLRQAMQELQPVPGC